MLVSSLAFRLHIATPLAGLAIAMPTLVAFNLPPSATYFNQSLALLGWSAWASMLAGSDGRSVGPGNTSMCPLYSGLGLMLCLALTAPYLADAPWALALSNGGLLLTVSVVAARAHDTGFRGNGDAAFAAFCVGAVVAGVASSGVGLIQVYTPWADGRWLAPTTVEGRAVGNLRQSNHLCTLLLWSIVAAIWLSEARLLRRWAVFAFATLMLFVVALSGSRTGVLGALLLALWGLVDSRLGSPTRGALLAAPVAHSLFWFAISNGAGRFVSGNDISSSRFGIWANTFDLIRAYPWTGVGFGEFNFAWTLTEFPDRPIAFFDHAHNLLLQFAVELGLPLAAVVLGLLGWALWRAARNCLRPLEPGAPPSPLRAAFVMVLLILMHSMLEYPLWYAYFFLPTAFLLGLCLSDLVKPIDPPRQSSHGTRIALSLRLGAIALMLGTAYSVYDYFRVVVIFAPPENPAPLTQRIAAGQRSVFFSHHADYAAATTSNDPAIALPAARRAAHYLLDTRLMMAWANALHATGDTERAKYIAQRLVEFRNSQSEAYFAPCKDPNLSEVQRPYQCFAPQRKLTFEDFR